MNTYYLKKFRKAAKKYVKVEILPDEVCGGKLVIATKETPTPFQVKIIRKVPNWILSKLFPGGILLRRKTLYANRYGYNELYEEEKNPIVLNEMQRDEQIAALKEARRLYILSLLGEKRMLVCHLEFEAKVVSRKNEAIAVMNELNRL